MRRAVRVDRSIGLLRPPNNLRISSSTIRSTTQHGTPAFSTSRPAQDDSISERLRKKIWGTDQPPGQKDPYTRAPTIPDADSNDVSKVAFGKVQKVSWKAPVQKVAEKQVDEREFNYQVQQYLATKYTSKTFSEQSLLLTEPEFVKEQDALTEKEIDAILQELEAGPRAARRFRMKTEAHREKHSRRRLQDYVKQRTALVKNILQTSTTPSIAKATEASTGKPTNPDSQLAAQTEVHKAPVSFVAPPPRKKGWEKRWDRAQHKFATEKVQEMWSFLESEGAVKPGEEDLKYRLKNYFMEKYQGDRVERVVETYGPVGNGFMQVTEADPLPYVPVWDAESMPAYKPADTMDGLEEVGQPIVPEYRYKGFMSNTLAGIDADFDTDQILEAALHRAVVEVFVVKQAGLPLSTVSKNFPRSMDQEEFTQLVQMSPSSTGAQLNFTGEASPEGIIESLMPTWWAKSSADLKKSSKTTSKKDVTAHSQPVVDETVEKTDPTESEEDVAADRSTVDPLNQSDTYDEIIASWDPSWLDISLEDSEVKFAVIKRFMQLSGKRISDNHLRSITTAGSLRSLVLTPPKPKKLVEALEGREDLDELPNLTFYGARQSYIHKEIAVGRWKVIQEELKARELPEYGEDAVQNLKGPKWRRDSRV